MKSVPSLGIGISTRDRWLELDESLGELAARGYDRWETVVIDDGSQQPCPPELSERYPWVRFLRVEKSIGYIAQRNRLANLITSDFYLSLDDDSFIEKGDIPEATGWLASQPKVIALAFRIVEGRGEAAEAAAPRAPYPVRFYIGCAHLLRREAFLNLGGYWELLESYCEEHEFAIRAWRAGWTVAAYPAVSVRHLVSPQGRDHTRTNRFLTRNDLWIAARHFPLPFALLSFLNCLPRQLSRPVHRPYWRAILGGALDALRSIRVATRERVPLSWRQYLAWRARVHPVGAIKVRANPLDASASRATTGERSTPPGAVPL